jgi:hypothetical protein
MPNSQTWVGCGIAGVLAVACYILAITLPWPETQLGTSLGLVVVSVWPILSIAYSMRKRSGLGPGWAIPSVVLGVLLIALNAATFPWPPADGGLFDIGPVIGLFVMALAGRLALLGRRQHG